MLVLVLPNAPFGKSGAPVEREREPVVVDPEAAPHTKAIVPSSSASKAGVIGTAEKSADFGALHPAPKMVIRYVANHLSARVVSTTIETVVALILAPYSGVEVVPEETS